MALSFKACLCSYNPRAQIKASQENLKPNIVHYPSIITGQNNWTIPYDNALDSHTSLRHFNNLTSNNINDAFHVEHARKVKSLKHLLRKEGDPTFEDLIIIDAIQRLGIDHYFQKEIVAILDGHYHKMSSTSGGDNDLYEVALRFRLLRQQGYYVPASAFYSFKDNDGNFKQTIRNDIKGLMSLYEATQLSIRGESILDEAGDYSYRVLNSWVQNLDNHQAIKVESALKQPYHKSFAMFMAKNFFSNLQGTKGWISVVKDLAKLDFKMVQSQHQMEIIQVSQWWKDLGLCKELKFARDQPLKWHIWSMACLIDPNLSEQRIELTMAISFIYIIDDIFDVYGTLDELTHFTEIVNRWDTSAAEQLPDYMKTCFKALDNITNEISYKVYKEHGWNPVESLRKAWIMLCNAFLAEAKWFATGHLPNAEEYLQNGIVSSGVHVVLVHVFFLLGLGINKEKVELIDNNPGIISSTATILRLSDDLGSAKDEDQDGNDGSYVECYMKENQGCSEESAREHVVHMISDAWKRLNEECLAPNPFSTTFTRASLNIARMVPMMYSYDDNHRLPILEEQMKSHLGM